MVHDNSPRLLCGAHAHDRCHADGGPLEIHPTDQLRIVMGSARQKLHLSPVQKFMEACEWVLTYRAFVDVIPHLHAHQHYSDVQRPVKLVNVISNLY